MKYNLTTAISIVIANMVGTGVFTSLGFQLFDLNNLYSIALLWIVGGFIALLGSYCYAELSAAFPRSGGEYHFLRISLGKTMGFLSGWTSAVAGFAAPIAASSIAFATYFSTVVDTGLSITAIAFILLLALTVVLFKTSILISPIRTFKKKAGTGTGIKNCSRCLASAFINEY